MQIYAPKKGTIDGRQTALFLYDSSSTRTSLLDDTQPEEEAAMSAHFEYLKKALAEGKLLMAGPVLMKPSA